MFEMMRLKEKRYIIFALRKNKKKEVINQNAFEMPNRETRC